MTTNGQQHGTDNQWMNSFTLGGTTYRCNEVNPLPTNRMGGVLIDLGHEDYVCSEGGGNHVVLPVNPLTATLSYVIHSINKFVKPTTPEPIVVGIYRSGVSEPIYYKEHDLFEEELLDNVINYVVEPGDYILALGNIAPYDHVQGTLRKAGDFYTYNMGVLAHGVNERHPALQAANIDNDLLVNLMFYYDMDITGHYLTCECFDEDFRMVTDEQELVCINASSYSVSVQLQPKLWWTDGYYYLVVYHNKHPYLLVKFVSQAGETDVVSTGLLVDSNPFYRLCQDNRLVGNRYMFCQLNGIGDLKRKVMKCLCQGDDAPRGHLMLSAPDRPSYEVMHTIAGMLHPQYRYTQMTVKQLMKEVIYDSDPQGTLEMKLARSNIVLYGLNELTKVENADFAEMLLKTAAYRYGFVVLYGTEDQLKRVTELYPGWKDILIAPNWWNVYSYTYRDAQHMVEHLLKGKNLTVNWSARQQIEHLIETHWDILKNWRKKDYEQWVETEIMSRMKERIFSENSFSQMFFQTVLKEDVTLTIRTETPVTDFGHCLAGLERMVGLKDVKDHLNLLFKRMDFDRKRQLLGLKKLQTGRPHMVFTGNPGTGKTTVAKLVGQAFKKLGYLTGGDVVTVERSQLVGRHIGETESRMTKILEKAKGHVLFIDEAYSLCDNSESDRRDFGCRALECLLPVLADTDSDIIVILAGYEKEMNEMMNLNPGMKGRFPFWFKFDDYNGDELHEIAMRLLEDNDYTLPAAASEKLHACIGEALQRKDRHFHNARWVNQLVQDGILAMMAERLYGTEPHEQNRSLFRTLTVDDVIRGYELMRTDKKTAPLRKVGFR